MRRTTSPATYLDVPNDALYPFGHGLTYGKRRFSNLRVSPESVSERDTLQISIDVANDGTRAADEAVFLFVRDKVASVA